MKFLHRWILSALLVSVAIPIAAQVATGSKTREHVQTLASEKFGGREAGSEGERQAADYIVSQLTRIGARPLPGRQDIFMRRSRSSNRGSARRGSRAGSTLTYTMPSSWFAYAWSSIRNAWSTSPRAAWIIARP